MITSIDKCIYTDYKLFNQVEMQRALTRNDIIQREPYKTSCKWGSSEQHFDHLIQLNGTWDMNNEKQCV